MKKFLLWLLFVIAMFAVFTFGTIGYAYYKAEPTVPDIYAKVEGKEMSINGYNWHEAVLNGITFKSIATARTLKADALGAFETLTPIIDISPMLNAKITITDKSKNTVFTGTAEEYKAFAFTDNGEYKINVTANIPQAEGKSYGDFSYDGTFTISVKPSIELSADSLEQGGVFSVVISNILDDTVPEIETDLSISLFTQADNTYTALVGVAYNREPGKYPITVRCGDEIQSFEVQVIHRDFDRQDLTMDAETDANTNTAAANAEFNKKVVQIYNTASSDTYWSGIFAQPCEGRITSEYGLRRYTNGAKTPVRHAGIDIACPEGTPVLAPNAGKVVLSEFLQLTGNTIVIEHGAGLKSYFYHMSSLNAAVDEIVTKGQQIGAVGTTGYSTGPHLHYDARIGNQSINPWQLFDGTSGIYFKKD